MKRTEQRILISILTLAVCFGYLLPMQLHVHAEKNVPLYLELTPQSYLTVSNDTAEKLACAPGIVTFGDGKVTYLDALFVLRASVGLETLDGAAVKAADVNGDGKLTYTDALAILRASVGLRQLN